MNTTSVIENTTDGKVDWTKRIDDDVDTEIIAMNIRKPLDDLQSSLKYLPIESSFDGLPEETKTHIISYLCDSESFKAASVCEEWKQIVKRRFTHGHIFEANYVIIGNHCSNYHECEDNSCFMPAQMLKASMTHKLDIPLTLCHPLTEIDARVVTEGLLSVSNLTIKSDCECKDEDDDLILSNDQLEDYFEGLEKSGGTMEKMELIQVDMTGINQDKLINCLLNKTKWLTLDEGEYGEMLNVNTFVDKLSKISTESKLKYLILYNFKYADYVHDLDMADALCQVENVKLEEYFPENILIRPVKMKSLLIIQSCDYTGLMSPAELLTLMGRMEVLELWGLFTPEQLAAARTLPDVEIKGILPPCGILKRGRDEIF